MIAHGRAGVYTPTMRLKEVTVSRTFNLGNYESKRVECTIEVQDEDTLEQVRDAAWRAVAYMAAQDKEQG